MIITNKDILEKYSHKHVIVRGPVEKWVADVSAAQWTSFNDLRISFPSADYVGNGRSRRIGTHAEYDKIKDCSIV